MTYRMNVYADYPFEFLHSAIVDYLFADEIEQQSTDAIGDDETNARQSSLTAIDKVYIYFN